MIEKSENEHPGWLKAMQNGSIGEARSRAFLLDRFWVLERSVDIDGADFIIQRRITAHNLLDRDAPRLGVVQAKFFGTAKTVQYVHKEYVVDRSGEPRNEFFLLCHTGGEQDTRVFLITAEDLQKEFPLTNDSGNQKYKVSFSQLEANDKFVITNRTLALDRIENRLKLADFSRNRRFMSWVLPSVNGDLDAILPEYKEPLDNDWGDISEGFVEIKETARTAMIGVEECYNLLLQIAEETDPGNAEKLIKELAYHCRDGLGKWSIGLPNDLYNEDFFRVCREHKAMVDRLKGDGLLDAFIGMHTELKKQITRFLMPYFPVDPNLIHRFLIRYNRKTLQLLRLESELLEASSFVGEAAKIDEWGHVVVSEPWEDTDISEIADGQLEAFWLPGRYGYLHNENGDRLEEFKAYDFHIYRDCMKFIYELHYKKTE